MTHVILQGEGSGRLLPFAKRRLERFHEALDLDAYSNTIKVGGATVRVAWSGEEDHIRIRAILGDDIYAHYRLVGDEGGALRYSHNYRQNFTARGEAVLSSHGVGIGDHQTFQAQIANVSGVPKRVGVVSRDGGRTIRLLSQSTPDATWPNAIGRFYAGRLRDGDGVVTGKRVFIYCVHTDGADLHPRLERLDITEGTAAKTTITFAADMASPAFFCVYTGHDHAVLSFEPVPDDEASVYYTADGGATWFAGPIIPEPDGAGESAIFYDMAPLSADGLLLALTHYNHFFYSDDYGETWGALPEQIPDFNGALLGASWARMIPLGEDAAMVFAPGVSAGWIRVWRTLDAGVSWQEVAPPRPEILAGTQGEHLGGVDLERGSTPERTTIVVTVLDTPDVYAYISRDSGTTWSRAGRIGDGYTGGTGVNPWGSIVNLGSVRKPRQPLYGRVLPHFYDNPVS